MHVIDVDVGVLFVLLGGFDFRNVICLALIRTNILSHLPGRSLATWLSQLRTLFTLSQFSLTSAFLRMYVFFVFSFLRHLVVLFKIAQIILTYFIIVFIISGRSTIIFLITFNTSVFINLILIIRLFLI